jgi:hypothetical protein
MPKYSKVFLTCGFWVITCVGLEGDLPLGLVPWSLVVAQPTNPSDFDESAFSRFKNEAPLEWNRVKELNAKFSKTNQGWQSTFSSEGFLLFEKKHAQAVKRDHKNLGNDHRLMLSTRTSAGEILVCMNPTYAFQLSRKDENQNWRLNEVIKLSSSENLTQRRDSFGALAGRPSGDGEENLISLPGSWFYSMSGGKPVNPFELEKVKFGKCKLVEYEGKECILVEGTFVSYGPSGESPNAFQCIYDPNNFWALLYSRATFAWNQLDREQGFNIEVKQDFQKGLSGGPRMVSKTLREWNHTCPNDPATLVSNSNTWLDNVPAKEFYLSSYGFPEPEFYEPPRPWWFYTSIVGMVLVVVGAVVFHFGKRLWREGAAKQNNKKRR